MILAATLSACEPGEPRPRQIAGADPMRGLATLRGAGCAACHDIPGVAWPKGTTGGPLEGFAARPMVAGRFPNRPDVLVRWLRDAPSLSPGTAMPASDLSEAQARDIAAYLYTLDD